MQPQGTGADEMTSSQKQRCQEPTKASFCTLAPRNRFLTTLSPPCRRRATPTPTIPVAFHRTGITHRGWVHGSAGSAGGNPQFSSPLLVALGGANPPCREAMILL